MYNLIFRYLTKEFLMSNTKTWNILHSNGSVTFSRATETSVMSAAHSLIN
jgi:hypothetical protein